MPNSFDVFLSHNRKDGSAVREIATALRRRQLRVWLDEDELVPGRPWQEAIEEIIQTTASAAVFVGKDGLGPWEDREMRACLSEFVDRSLPVILVLLPDAPSKPQLPLFLRALTWVDLRDGITDYGLDRLVWGITGKKPGLKAGLSSTGPPSRHNLPFLPLGDLLKGRDKELRKLSESLENESQKHRIIQGLGGIGKTRLAVEYAWRFGSRYKAALFVRADTPDDLRSGLAVLARADLLDLSERKAKAAEETVHAVLHWLKSNSGWLLILDNVDNMEAELAVVNLLPSLSEGHVLITSRLRSWPKTVQKEPLDTISLAEAQAFLLERTAGERHHASDDTAQAELLAKKLDGLPLALEQAGAYIVHNRLSLAEYSEAWKHERDRVLSWYKEAEMGYPASVAVTWQRSFGQLSSAAAGLLRLTAFLAPEPIPVEMLKSEVEGNRDLIPTALAELESYSLIARQATTFTVHRLVQQALLDEIPFDLRRNWLNLCFEIVRRYVPEDPSDLRTWPVWNLLRPHATALLRMAAELGGADVTVALLSRPLATYLVMRGLYAEAEPMLQKALEIEEQFLGTEHPNVATTLNNLAALFQATNRLSEAEPLMRRALYIDKAFLGTRHPHVARDLSNLATLLGQTNRHSEAEQLLREALIIDEDSLGTEHREVGIRLMNLASLLQTSNRSSEAEPLMCRASEIFARSLGVDHPYTKQAQKSLIMIREKSLSPRLTGVARFFSRWWRLGRILGDRAGS